MKNIVVCVDLTEDSVNALETIQHKLDLSQSVVHLVHVFEIHVGNIELTPVVYPTADQYPVIEKNILEILSTLSAKLHLKPEQVKMKCIFNHSKESTLHHYLNEVNADLAVLATRGKHGIAGFFASSLADYLCKYAPCDLLVLRPKKTSK